MISRLPIVQEWRSLSTARRKRSHLWLSLHLALADWLSGLFSRPGDRFVRAQFHRLEHCRDTDLGRAAQLSGHFHHRPPFRQSGAGHARLFRALSPARSYLRHRPCRAHEPEAARHRPVPHPVLHAFGGAAGCGGARLGLDAQRALRRPQHAHESHSASRDRTGLAIPATFCPA